MQYERSKTFNSFGSRSLAQHMHRVGSTIKRDSNHMFPYAMICRARALFLPIYGMKRIVIASREPHMNDTIEIRYTDLLYDCSEIETNTTTIMRRDTTSHITANDWLLNSTTTHSRVWECIVESIARLFLFYFLAQRRRTDSCEILVGVLVSSRKHICSVSRARSPQLTKHK